MTNDRDPIIEIAELREAIQQWKDYCHKMDEELKDKRRDLILLARRNTLLVLENEELKTELAKINGKAKPLSTKFNEVQAINERLCLPDCCRSENSQ